MALFGNNKKKVEQLEFQVTELNKLYENIRRSLHNTISCTFGIIETDTSYIVYKSEKAIYRPIFIKEYNKGEDPDYACRLAHELLDLLND